MTFTLWFTGLSGSGKSTIANKIVEIMRNEGMPVVLVDGDEVRKSISKELGYTKEERDKHVTRMADICYLINKSGVSCVASVISPTRSIRRYARSIIKNFIEIYVKCDIETCKKRDAKGLYKKVETGEIKDFVGINIPYEEPKNPEIIVDTTKMSFDECVDLILRVIIC
jgi:adenylyl-sulfate kinase